MSVLEPGYDMTGATDVLAGVTVPGRMERLGDRPPVFADVGHNPHAARWLADEIKRQNTGSGKVYAVYAALADKDVEGVAGAMSGVVDVWYLAGLSVPRGLTGEVLRQRISGEVQHNTPVSVVDTVSRAVSAVLEQARPEDLVIIFGSFFTVGEARAFLQP
jgi:dihydrofolate synthase/folylpolyglutamate synthase